MKLCSDCVHFSKFLHTRFDGYCQRPGAGWIHPVSGDEIFPLATNERLHPLNSSGCGMSGQHFQYSPGSPPEPDTSEDSAF